VSTWMQNVLGVACGLPGHCWAPWGPPCVLSLWVPPSTAECLEEACGPGPSFLQGLDEAIGSSARIVSRLLHNPGVSQSVSCAVCTGWVSLLGRVQYFIYSLITAHATSFTPLAITANSLSYHPPCIVPQFSFSCFFGKV